MTTLKAVQFMPAYTYLDEGGQPVAAPATAIASYDWEVDGRTGQAEVVTDWVPPEDWLANYVDECLPVLKQRVANLLAAGDLAFAAFQPRPGERPDTGERITFRTWTTGMMTVAYVTPQGGMLDEVDTVIFLANPIDWEPALTAAAAAAAAQQEANEVAVATHADALAASVPDLPPPVGMLSVTVTREGEGWRAVVTADHASLAVSLADSDVGGEDEGQYTGVTPVVDGVAVSADRDPGWAGGNSAWKFRVLDADKMPLGDYFYLAEDEPSVTAMVPAAFRR